MVKKSCPKFKKDGATVIEVALVFPMLLLVTLAAIEYGWLFLKAQQITLAAREGARVGVRASATSAQVSNVISNVMTQAGITVYDADFDDPNLVASGSIYTVDVNVPVIGTNLPLINAPDFLPLPSHLGASVSMTKEGP